MQQVYRVIADIRRQGTTALLVEQNANMALSVADRGYVLETGRLVTQGKPEALWDNEDVRTAPPRWPASGRSNQLADIVEAHRDEKGQGTNPLPRESVARPLAVPLLRALTMLIRRR
jgi:energy-coupling factor transporter ATP-binding protein EcfA2